MPAPYTVTGPVKPGLALMKKPAPFFGVMRSTWSFKAADLWKSQRRPRMRLVRSLRFCKYWSKAALAAAAAGGAAAAVCRPPSADDAAIRSTYEAIERLDGVLSVAMVYHQVESDPDKEI